MNKYPLAKKSLGQNFLINETVVKNICKNAIINDRVILEVGAGTGCLTREIIKNNPKYLIIIEKDSRMINILNKLCEKLNFKDKTMIINDDALHFSLVEILQMYQDNNKDNYHNLTKKLTIISNLPYNIGTTLVMNWIGQTDEIEEIVVMLQKEVVDRFCAKQSTKDYGKISVLTQSVCNTKKLFDVSQKCFIPMPKVISSVIKITPKENKISKEEYQKLNSFCKVAFSQRRKKLIKILKNSKEYKHIIPDNNIIINNNRADEISIENYLKLLKYL